MSIEQFNDYASVNTEVDREIDKKVAQRARQLYSEGNNVIVEGRTQFYHLKESSKIYIFTSLEEGARRILQQRRQSQTDVRNEDEVKDLDEMIAKASGREENDVQRYIKFYGVDHRDHRHYDKVIDSTSISIESVVLQVLEFVYQKQKK